MSSQTTKRLARIKKIAAAKRDLESALLTMKQHGIGLSWINDSFGSLYYLERLARKAP